MILTAADGIGHLGSLFYICTIFLC